MLFHVRQEMWGIQLYSQCILDLLLVCGIVFIILHKPSSLFSLLLAAWHVQYSECYIIITKYCVAPQPPTCQEVKMTGWFSGCLSGYLAQSSTKILKSNSKSNVEQTYMNLSVKLKYFVSCIIFGDWLTGSIQIEYFQWYYLESSFLTGLIYTLHFLR